MSVMFLFLALGSAGHLTDVSGTYRSVTETEYAIELDLRSSWQAELELRMWVAGEEPQPSDTSVLHGTWSHAGKSVAVDLPSVGKATYSLEPCLSYAEFGAAGCSPGLKLVDTTLPVQYELPRYGLWRADRLQVQP